MGMLNIIWIVIFLVLGAGLTVQAFEAINFAVWDNLFGIAVFVVALFGLYCMTKDMIPFVKRLSEKLEPKGHLQDAKHSGAAAAAVPASAVDRPVHNRVIFSRRSRTTEGQAEKSERDAASGSIANKSESNGLQAGKPRQTPRGSAPARGKHPPASAAVLNQNSSPAAKSLNQADNSNADYMEDLEKILQEVDASPREMGGASIGTDEVDLDELLK